MVFWALCSQLTRKAFNTPTASGFNRRMKAEKLRAPHYTADSQYVEVEIFQHSLALDHKYRGATLLSV